jgi:hypothetical protein
MASAVRLAIRCYAIDGLSWSFDVDFNP